MEIPLLHDIVVIFGLSIVVLLVCHRIHLPTVVGFIFTGVLSGPHGLQLIRAESDVDLLANIGIVLLLFIVGMEFSFKKIVEYRRYFLIGGTLQVFLTVLISATIALLMGRPLGESVFLGFLISLSSTAIVLRILDEKLESDSPHGHVILGMMIFQDIVAIPMMLMIPMLSGAETDVHMSTLWTLAKGLIILVVVLFSAVKLVPKLLYLIAKTRSRELFLLSVFTICFSVAWLTSSVGLSLSLGAFLAGLIISDSEYRTEAIGDILPFQDLFTSFFFVSIGMLLNVQFFLEQPLYILLITVGIMSMKALVVGATTVILGMPLRTVVMTGLAMAQVGEFSFVLAKAGSSYGLGSDFHYQLFLAFALLSMAFTPTLMGFSSHIASLFLRLPIPVRLKSGLRPSQIKVPQGHKDHILIIGFGLSGRNLARAARETQIPYVVLEINAETVRKEKLKGEPIHFGDATHETVLTHADIVNAKVIAVVINDFVAAGQIVELARKLNPRLYIIVRTRYMRQMKSMYDAGADEVIPDEFGSSIEVFTRVMRKFHVPTEQLDKIIADMRVEGYEMLRLLYKEPTTLADLKITLTDVLIETFRVHEGAGVNGKTLGEIDLRKIYGVTAMLVRRGNVTISSPDAQTRLLANDVIVLVGTTDHLKQAAALFKPQAAEKPVEAMV